MQLKNGDGEGMFGLREAPEDWRLKALGNIDDVLTDPKTSLSRASVAAPISWGRFLCVTLCFLFVGTIFLGKTAYLQIGNGTYYRALAEANRIRTHAIPAHRGVLKDRNGIPLAENLPTFRLVGYTSSLPEEGRARVDALYRASELFDLDEADLAAAALIPEGNEEILLGEDIPYANVIAFLGSGEVLPGMNVELVERRGYPTDAIPTLSHVVGYTGPVNEEEFAVLEGEGYRSFDAIGKQGIEASHEEELRGTYGEDVFEVNAQGLPLRVISHTDPLDGKDLTLTIDARLQAYTEIVLEEHLKNRDVKRAAVVALNPQNGEVLALVSYPAYDANAFSQGISETEYASLINDPAAPLFPRATSGEYPSGSTIKPFFAAAALSEGIVTPTTTFLSTGGLMLGNRFFPDWRPGGHGYTNVYHAIADSVNTYFYMIGGGNESFEGLGLEKLMAWAQTFGLGSVSGIDLEGEADGFLPSKEWKEEVKGEPWYIGDTYNVSIGQGDILVTPLQMARGTAAIANGGILVSPHLVIGEGGTSVRILDEALSTIVRDAMRRTVTQGTATSLQDVSVLVAGKTGTAQWNAKKTPHSWFTGFAPFENPTIAIAVIIEEGGDQTLATPVAKDILTWYFRP